MKLIIPIRYTAIFIAAVLAGCSGGVPQDSAAPSIAATATSVVKSGWVGLPGALRPGAALQRRRPEGRPSGVHPACCVQTLFVSEANGNNPAVGGVELFKYPQGTYDTQLAQPPETFQEPQGECAGTTQPQAVFIANTYASTIDQYDHSGTYQMHLLDTGEYPVSCAYRSTGPNSGVLAVGNIVATSGGQGSVSIFTDNNGTWTGPTAYTPASPTMWSIYFMDYRATTLFLDGLGPSSANPFFARMSPGGSFTQIPLLGGSPNFPGSVQTIGSYIALGDQLPSAGSPNIYEVLPNGTVLANSTTFSPSPGDIIQFFRKGNKISAADNFNANADIYHYPSGNFATPVVTSLYSPVGVAISHQ